ncbi:MAG: hypothetical protein QOF78_1045 [Phycisphaerales bacterium]|jgi:hypothetical protein|nr:hypothetical protein [Phycisphaerales bacterium]
MKIYVVAVCIGLLSFGAAVARGAEVVEKSFASTKAYADPFNDVDVDVIFTTPGGKDFRVPAFWAGGQGWTVRYSSHEPGKHRFRTVCTDATNAALHDVKGEVDIAPYAGKNPLYRHGPIRVAAGKKHFEHADGTPFFWLADTWWMGFTQRLRFPDEFATLTKDRTGKGFTVVQIVAGLYPDMPAFDERGANEAGFPWERDYARVNPAYFDQADKRVQHLVENGIAPCVVGAWGYHLPWLGVERMKKHWRYVIARWGAYPTFWCAAGEGAMPYYLAPDKGKDAELQRRGWTEIARYIHEVDPFDRPVTIHPTDMSRNQVTDAAVLDFEMLQTGHGDRASIGPTISLLRASRAAAAKGGPAMPTINAEVCYEGILGTCDAKVERIMGWTSLLAGTAGHTYGANGIWQLNRRGEPYGKSPHGGTYGPTPWDEAMKLPGSGQTGLAKKLLETLEWWRFEPHDDWATWARSPDESAIESGAWIWHAADGNAAHDAPLAKRSFRRTINVPAQGKIERATIDLSADDRFVATLNGKEIGAGVGHERPRRIDLAPLLRRGENFLQVEAENVYSNVPNNPAGFICAGAVVLDDGSRVEVKSDTTWQSRAGAEGDWATVKVNAAYGEPPWGKIGTNTALLSPQAAGVMGVAGALRVIYLAEPTPVRVMRLERDVDWVAEVFDPVSGGRKEIAMPKIEDGACRFDPPTGMDDWVLVLRRR